MPRCRWSFVGRLLTQGGFNSVSRYDGVRALLEATRVHLGTNLYHQLLRRVLQGLELEMTHWRYIHALIDGVYSREAEEETITDDELLGIVAALVAFVRAIRSQICHRLRDLLGDVLRTRPEDRLLRDATLVNFDANMQRLNDLTRQLIREIETLYPEYRDRLTHPTPGELDYGCGTR